MNKLTTEKRAQILQMMAEGNSIRAIVRMSGASKNTITKLLVDAGTAFAEYHDKHVRNLNCRKIQCDEIWSFTYCKGKNVAMAKSAVAGAGDTWTWTSLDADSKLICNWMVGSRDAEYAMALMDDLRSRLDNRVQLTTDGHKAYLQAVEGAFGGDVDYAQLIKLYGAAPEAKPGKYSPGECVGIRKTAIEGKPDKKDVSTSYVERQNLTMRMSMRRFTRLTNGFSKKLENHTHALAIYFLYYNFVRIHQTLRITPAMAAGVTDKLWDFQDMVKVLEEWEAKQLCKAA